MSNWPSIDIHFPGSHIVYLDYPYFIVMYMSRTGPLYDIYSYIISDKHIQIEYAELNDWNRNLYYTYNGELVTPYYLLCSARLNRATAPLHKYFNDKLR